MKILEFRYLNTDDVHDLKYQWCSRVYEYKIVLDFLSGINFSGMTVHNTASGIREWLNAMQILFKKDLDNLYNVRHSDIDTFNIVSGHDENLYNVVLNISVIEHLPQQQRLMALDNLWSTVKSGGYLVLTFDLPAVNLQEIENWCGQKCQLKPENAVSGSNSAYPQHQYKNYNFILLILQK
jgi:hypothetical protein